MKKHQLSYHEKRGILSIIIMISVYGSMFYDAYSYYQSDIPTQGLLAFWGNQFLELFLCLVFVYTLLVLLFNRLNEKITGEKRPKIKDERDTVIELNAIHASYYTLALGVFVAMLSSLRVETYSPVFLVIMGSFMVSGIIADVIRVVSYRKLS